MFYLKFNELRRDYRKKTGKNLTQKHVREYLDIRENTLRDLINGELRQPYSDMLATLSTYFMKMSEDMGFEWTLDDIWGYTSIDKFTPRSG